MQGSLEEKCLQKLREMEKFLPFLDFMIDKIRKKSGEISLECQLSKLEGMRSMISEKNGRCNLDTIIKVEDVLEKLIAKLDYKEQCNSLLKEPTKFLGSSKINEELVKVSNSVTNEPSITASVSVIPSTTTTTIFITNAANLFEVTTDDSRPRDSQTNAVDLIMKTLEIPMNSNSKNNTDNVNDNKELTDSLEQSCIPISSKSEVFTQNLELNLDKDLDGFELTDCLNLPQIKEKNTALDSVTENAGKLSSKMDLLSSSRQKLLKSLQKKLNPPSSGNILCQPSGVKTSDSQSISASSLINKSNVFNEEKSKSEISVGGLNSEIIVNCSSDKCARKKSSTVSIPYLSPQSLSSECFINDNKSYCDLENVTNEINSKQKLREKLSADICEVYRVPGKSVGGSLRSLKEAKDQKKLPLLGEEELFKPDKIIGISKRIRSSTENKEKEQEKSMSVINFSSSKNNETHDKTDTKKNLKGDNVTQQIEDSQKYKRGEKHFTKEENLKERSQNKKHFNGTLEGKSDKKIIANLDKNTAKEKINKLEETQNFKDKELLEFVKENTHFLPNLSKLKPSELRKGPSSLFKNSEGSCLSSLDEDGIQDLDEFMNDKQCTSNKLKGNLKAPRNSISTSKIKTLENTEWSDLKSAFCDNGVEIVSKIIDSKIQDTENFSNDDILDDTAFAQKLIEDTTESACNKKKGFAVFQTENVLDNNACKKSVTSKLLCISDRDPRKKKIQDFISGRSNSSAGSFLDCKSDFENKKNDVGFYLDKHQYSSLDQQNSNDIHPNLNRDLHVNEANSLKEQTKKSSENERLGSLNDILIPDITTNCSPEENQLFHPLCKSDFINVKNYQNGDLKLPRQCTTIRSKEVVIPNNKNFSYAEYKRLKLKQQKYSEKFQYTEKEKNYNCVATKKKQRNIIMRGATSKGERPKSSSNLELKSIANEKLINSTIQHEFKKDEEGFKKKFSNHKKKPLDNDDVISPLEKLYHTESITSTGRGYGLQNFKIPKKVQKNNFTEENKQKDSTLLENCEKKQMLSNKQENHITKDILGESITTGKVGSETFEKKLVKEGVDLSEMCKSSTLAKNAETKNLTEGVNIENNCHAISNSMEKLKEDICLSERMNESKGNIYVEENLHQINELKNINQEGTIKKCEVVECDSSVENIKRNNTNETKISHADKEKCTLISKDEITQEFVEALIRKSFQSGEGKLLLTQAKLFEEFTRKLNSKKLKTIQKIINSDSDSDSSSSNSSSRSEKNKRTKGKKLGRNIKRKKKKIKKVRKQEKKEESKIDEGSEKEGKEEDDSIKNSNAETGHLLDQKNTNEQKIKNKSTIKFKRYMSKRRRQCKQGQTKLLEQILNEAPSSNILEGTESIITNSQDVKKEIEQKPKTKPKTKVKTELDRLHDDIRSMFISEGVVTATGQRMCRILKESGGNVKNLDIVKESAKMVEEEKLKKVEVRENPKLRSRNSAFSSGRSRSRSSDKLIKLRDRSKCSGRTNSFENAGTGKSINVDASSPLVSAENLKKESYVVMHKLDLSNFGYGKKISEGCFKFNLTPGRNVAYRGSNRRGTISRCEVNLAKHVYLPRNKRKCLRLKEKISRKNHKRKSLLEIIKNLPLKMAKMKHLEILDTKKEKKKRRMRKENIQLTKSVLQNKESENHSFNIEAQKSQLSQNLSSISLLDYSFDKKKSVYSCKLCYHQTSNITRHYKTDHTESEVLISRLSREEAQKAVAQAKENDYNGSGLKKEKSLEINENIKPCVNEGLFYKCRMCSQNKTSDFNSFFFHVSSHTGEYRYSCPSKGCSFSADTREYMKIHILSRHPKSWRNLYNKIIELFPIPSKCQTLFGYLCSECNFVQIFESNLKNHIQKNHSNDENIDIIKIDMSDKVFSSKKKYNDIRIKKDKNIKNKTNEELHKCKREDVFIDVECVEFEYDECQKKSTAENLDVEQPVSISSKKHDLVLSSSESKEKEGTFEESLSKAFENSNNFFEVSLRETKNQSEKLGSTIFNHLENESTNKQNVPYIKDSDILTEKNDNQVLSSKTEFRKNSSTKKQPFKLKIGPLEVQIFGDSGSLYECHVKGCLFSTKIFELFEKHVRISHSKINWSKACEICVSKGTSECHISSSKLSIVLQHLKFHENIVLKKNLIQEKSKVYEDLIIKDSFQNETENSNESFLKNSCEFLTQLKEDEENLEIEKSESGNAAYPPKPLLRVRNFFGDRLSTPKENFIDKEDIVTVIEKGSSLERCESEDNLKDNSPKMFTIENVRSLQVEKNLLVSDVETEIPLTKNNELTKKSTLDIAKPVVVRSCPTRQIAIQPESKPVSVESNLKLVKTSSVNPVVLGTLSNVTPIRILSSSSPNYKFAVQSVMVSAANSFLTKSNTVSVIRPVPPLSVNSSNASISSTQCENKNNSLISTEQESLEKQLSNSSNSKISKVACDKDKTLIKRVRTKVIRSNDESTSSQSPGLNSCLLSSEADKKTELKEDRQNISRPIAGNKSFKDAKIYQEMLTKMKLCHLFKCMAVECSFTCNDENIFTQHLGLHEAQRRMKNQKVWKTVSNSKLKKAFNWQQCAYCCEVLSNSSFGLSRHVIIEHGHCIYQCAYCFYRAVSQSYVEIHQNLAHAQLLKSNSRLIYKCKSFSRAPSPASALEKQGRRQSIRPYHCDQCGKKFFITQEFMNHLMTEHQTVTTYTCHICKNLCFKADRLIIHYKLHSYCTYQCAYCLHGTETEKEMVFHLCNFHFSQPAYMYVRALADNQKCNGSQLDSLKVIHYESDTLNPECIEEVDLEDQTAKKHLKDKESQDLSIIVAELGITAENEEANDVTPLFKELACLGNKNYENLSVKSLLPNAQFSSENDNSGENCSVLISSGLSFNGTEQNEEKEISIPLGQLNVESVTVHSAPNSQSESSSKNILPSDKNMKLNEIIINIHHKEKPLLPFNVEDTSGEFKEKQNVATAIHKMPPVVLTRITDPKNIYSSRSGHVPKKINEDSVNRGENLRKNREENVLKVSHVDNKDSFISQDKKKGYSNLNFTSISLSEENKANKEILESQPMITNIRSLCIESFEKNNTNLSCCDVDNFPKITEVCSLSSIVENQNCTESSKTMSNIQSVTDSVQLLEPQIFRIENCSQEGKDNINETVKSKIISETKIPKDEKEEMGKSDESPEVIILYNEKNVLTVTLDSEDEKEPESFQDNSEEVEKKINVKEVHQPNETIRKEMELLRNQIANETECLLIDDTDNENSSDLSLTMKPEENKEKPVSLLTPIEEAICSLNKRLEEEVEKLEEEKLTELSKNKNEPSTLPRTRSLAKEKTRKEEATLKNDSDDSNLNSRSGMNDIRKKNSKFKVEFSDKNLYMCGNEKCFFLANNESELKDHLYVCDNSRDSVNLLCPHCSRQIKQINAYIEHLKHHGEKKYSCGLCSFKSAVENSVTRHIKQKHRCGQIKSIPCDPPKKDHLIFYPKNYKLDKVDFEVNGYSPGDEDKLPLQAVYQVNVKCAKCPYFTKVRSNMVRHLKIHVKSAETEGFVVVPSTAPTNPVPCLDTKVRMFDKMTNLAASSQLAQAKEKISIETLAPEEEAKLPHFIPEQMRYKCCLPDCNYITVDDGMLKHHIKALHGEINYYSCPHCRNTVHADVRHVTLDKICHHLKYHDSKLYKCAHCIYFHYQKSVVEKHTLEKHPDRKHFVHIVREPKGETSTSEELQPSETSSKVWKCGLCNDFYSLSKVCILEHLVKVHNTRSKYKCKLCEMKSNHFHAFFSHFASKHVGEKVSYLRTFEQVNSSSSESFSTNVDVSNEHFDTTPLWQRGAPRVRHIRGILIEEAEVKTKKTKKNSEETNEANVEVKEVEAPDNSYFCPLCNDKKPFYTKNADIFRSHLYQELNYQQFACILCGKMFVDKKDYEKHHSKFHQDKPQSLKQTKEDGEITFWVDKMITKQKEKIESKKRRLSEEELNDENRGSSKKRKKAD